MTSVKDTIEREPEELVGAGWGLGRADGATSHRQNIESSGRHKIIETCLLRSTIWSSQVLPKITDYRSQITPLFLRYRTSLFLRSLPICTLCHMIWCILVYLWEIQLSPIRDATLTSKREHLPTLSKSQQAKAFICEAHVPLLLIRHRNPPRHSSYCC